MKSITATPLQHGRASTPFTVRLCQDVEQLWLSFARQRKLREARQAYLEAANILRTQNTSASRTVLSDALLNLGTLLRSMGLYDEALKAQMETVDLDAKSDRPDKTIAVAQDFTDIGNTYADLKDLSTALQYLDRAFGVYMAELQLRKKQRRSLADLCEVYRALADDLGSLGDAYAADGNSKEAILRYSETQLADELCHSQPHQIALTLNNIGELYIRHLNQPSAAQHYYERALLSSKSDPSTKHGEPTTGWAWSLFIPGGTLTRKRGSTRPYKPWKR